MLNTIFGLCRSERIGMRQSQVDKLYAGLKDLSEERRGKLEERFRLFQLNREVDDLEQWIAEREVVAGSHELGQDYEHVTVSQKKEVQFLLAVAVIQHKLSEQILQWDPGLIFESINIHEWCM